MTVVYKVLGQVNPSANTVSTLYTVPAANSAIISTVSICNQAATATTFRLAVSPAGASIAAQHYLNYDTPLPGNDSITVTIGMTLAATDVVRVYAGSTTVSFNAFGNEIY
jgi:hypothetical protein